MTTLKKLNKVFEGTHKFVKLPSSFYQYVNLITRLPANGEQSILLLKTIEEQKDILQDDEIQKELYVILLKYSVAKSCVSDIDDIKKITNLYVKEIMQLIKEYKD